MSFQLKIITIVTVACIICTGTAMYIASQEAQVEGEQSLINKGEAILTRLEASRDYVANQGLLRETIADLVQKYPNGDLPEEQKQKVLNVVPIYASLKIGMKNARKDKYKFRVAARDARRKTNEANELERSFLERFEEDPDLKQITYKDKEKNAMWVMRPVRLSEDQGCLECHGAPSTSPFGNGQDILGFKMENWKDNKLHGMFAVISSLEPIQAAVTETNVTLAKWGGGITVAVIAIVFFLLKGPMNILNNISARISSASQRNLQSSDSLKGTAQSVSAASTEQSAAIQETMASMSEMSSMISRTISVAKDTEKMATELNDKTNQGQKVMTGMVDSMNSIKQANERLNEMIGIIKDISSKTNVINDIVFKTQLLSVNASVEAARAGNHGKGFAVVAEEVGNLAQVSGQAAEEIRDMLEKSQRHVEAIVTDTNSRVEEGERVSKDALSSFKEISDGINTIHSYARNVNEATVQQEEGISQISEAMGQMDTASQQNSKMAEQVSLMSGELHHQSQELATLNNETQLLVKGRLDHGPGQFQSPAPQSQPQAQASGGKVLSFFAKGHGPENHAGEAPAGQAPAEPQAPPAQAEANQEPSNFNGTSKPDLSKFKKAL